MDEFRELYTCILLGETTARMLASEDQPFVIQLSAYQPTNRIVGQLNIRY